MKNQAVKKTTKKTKKAIPTTKTSKSDMEHNIAVLNQEMRNRITSIWSLEQRVNTLESKVVDLENSIIVMGIVLAVIVICAIFNWFLCGMYGVR